MLINNTNREHETWSREQLLAAERYGEIVDMIMPGIPAEADEAEADRIAGLVVRRILRRLGREEGPEVVERDCLNDAETAMEHAPEERRNDAETAMEHASEERRNDAKMPEEHAVICQGDFTLVYRVVRLLKEAGVPVMAPTFQRVTKPTLRPDGTTVPGYSFDFVQFREY